MALAESSQNLSNIKHQNNYTDKFRVVNSPIWPKCKFQLWEEARKSQRREKKRIQEKKYQVHARTFLPWGDRANN